MRYPSTVATSCGNNNSSALGNAEEGSVYIDLNDSMPKQEKSNEKNDHPSVPPGFETNARNTHEHQENQQQELDLSTIKVGNTMPAMIVGEFHGGFWISIKDGDSSKPPLRGMIFKPEASKKNNESPISATMMGIRAFGSGNLGTSLGVRNGPSKAAIGSLSIGKVISIQLKHVTNRVSCN